MWLQCSCCVDAAFHGAYWCLSEGCQGFAVGQLTSAVLYTATCGLNSYPISLIKKHPFFAIDNPHRWQRKGTSLKYVFLPFFRGAVGKFAQPYLGHTHMLDGQKSIHRSARMGLFRKSSYERRMPSMSSVLYFQPKAALFDTSSNLRGVPLGLVVSHRIFPL